jgi:glycine betaine/proline transport system ATP-binding protein
VLTARDVMQDIPTDHARIPAETPVREILKRFAQTPSPLSVERDGEVIGTVTPDSLTARLGQ